MTMMAMKAAVAFQTTPQTSAMSLAWTTPVARAMPAPMQALQPMPRPRGCQMTRTRVKTKMAAAASMDREVSGRNRAVWRAPGRWRWRPGGVGRVEHES